MNATKTIQFSILLSVLTTSQSIAQLRIMPSDESAGRLALLQCVDFENLTNRVRAPFRSGGIIFSNASVASPSGGPVVVVLEPRQADDPGGTMTFLNLPRFVVLDILNAGAGPFTFQVIDGLGQRFRVTGQGVASGNALFGIEATYGVRQMRLVSYEESDGSAARLRIDSVCVTKVATPTKLVAKPVWSTQVNLTWKHASEIETGFLIERSSPDRSNFVQIATVEPDVKSFQDIVGPTNTYFYRVRANHPDGESAYSNEARARTPGPEFRLRVTSIAGEDGYVCEEMSIANRGERIFPTGSGIAGLVAGDQRQNQQCKAIISFDTSALPQRPEVVSAVLTLRQAGRSGNPLGLGLPLVDINSNDGFSGSPALQITDFETVADAVRVAVLRPKAGDITTDIGRISSFAFRSISTTGRTQFRIYFAQPDDGDSIADFIAWNSGENTGDPPVLEIIYRAGTE